jgi:hypothetical protein
MWSARPMSMNLAEIAALTAAKTHGAKSMPSACKIVALKKASAVKQT